jgi:RNA polymerase sigma-70 factor (ECF subfamily)
MTADLPTAGVITKDERSERVPYRDLPDSELLRRLSLCDTAALEALYDRYATLVYSTARRILGDAHLAEDVSQEVFLRIWRQPERYAAEKGSFVAWLLSVTRNRAIDEVRKRRRYFRHETASPEEQRCEVPADDGHDPALSAELLNQRLVVKAALACLPLKQRRAIELAYFGGLSNMEIAHVVGCPLGTVKTRIRLGMRKLREMLKQPDKAR